MIFKLYILVILTDLWCYLHEGYDVMPYIIGAGAVILILEPMLKRVWEVSNNDR